MSLIFESSTRFVLKNNHSNSLLQTSASLCYFTRKMLLMGAHKCVQDFCRNYRNGNTAVDLNNK